MNNNFDKEMSEFLKKSSELRLEDFITNIKNENVADETIENMFWDIYRQGNKEKIANALRALEYDRKKVAVEVAEAVENDLSKEEENDLEQLINKILQNKSI